MNKVLKNAVKHWNYIAPLIIYPKNEKEFNRLVEQLDELLDLVGNNEKHSLMGLIDIISHLIANYETNHIKEPACKGIAALRYLMQLHSLKQTDLAGIASQGVLSEILNGKRKLSLRQIQLLAKLFKVSPATFID